MSTTTSTPAPTPAPGKQMTVVEKNRLTLRRLFDQQRPELAKLLPRNMDPGRLLRMALTECVKNPELLECTAESWALAMQVCASQGLFPDSALGLMYLVPRNNRKRGTKDVNAMRGYQGDIELARRSGEIDDIYAEVVYTRDHYKVVKGLNRSIEHVPFDGDDEPGDLKAVYAVAKLKTGEIAFVTLSKRDVMRHKASAQGIDRDDSPWRKHEASMWKKTAIHELFKWLPKATEKMQAIAASIATDERPIDVTAETLALGEALLPEAPATPASLAERLEGSAPATTEGASSAPAAAATGCAHEAARKHLARIAVGAVVVCGECAQELRRLERQPGDEDDAPFEVLGPPDEDPKAAIQALAGAAGDPTKPRSGGRQGRIVE